MKEKLDVIVFPGGFNLPLWAALETGSFARRRLDVSVHYTSSSIDQLSSLINGRHHLALTAFDNVVAYQEGHGEAEDVVSRADLFAFMGGDNAFLKLVAGPDITSYDDLRGKTIAVDALTTGFAFVLREMLARNGVAEEDVTFIKAGGAKERFQGLLAGRFSATLLLTPFELLARKQNCSVLEDAVALLPHYQGVVGATRRAWAQQRPELLTAFIAAYVEALGWLFTPGNSASAVELMRKNLPDMSQSLADETCSILLHDETGFEKRARFDPTGMETVLRLRNKYRGADLQLDALDRYYDDTFYCAAVGAPLPSLGVASPRKRT